MIQSVVQSVARWLAFITLSLACLSTSIAATNDTREGIEAMQRHDYDKAVMKLLPAANAGDPLAQQAMGALYFQGNGVPLDIKLAFRYLHLAAEAGLADSQFLVGSFYYRGIGVQANKVLGRKWMQMAANQGHERARESLSALQERVSPTERQTGSGDASAVKLEDSKTPPRSSTQVAGDQLKTGHISVTLFQDKEGPHGKDELPISLSISPDSSKVSVGTSVGRVVVIDARSGAKLSESWHAADPKSASGSKAARATQFSPDSKSIASIVGKRIFITDPTGANRTQSAPFDSDPSVLAFSPDGSLLAVAIDSFYTRLCVLRAPVLSVVWCVGPRTAVVQSTVRNPKGFEYDEPFNGIAWLPDGSSLTAVSRGLAQFSKKDGTIINRIAGNGHYRPGIPYTISSDGTQIVSMSGANLTRWALSNGEMLQKSQGLVIAKGPIFLTPNGQRVVLGDVQQPPTIQILAAETLQKEVSLRAMIDRAEKGWVFGFQIAQGLDIYAILIRKPVRMGTDGLEISDYDVQIWPMPSFTGG